MQNVSDMQQEAEAFVKNRRKTLFEESVKQLDAIEEYIGDNITLSKEGANILQLKLADAMTFIYFIVNEGDLK